MSYSPIDDPTLYYTQNVNARESHVLQEVLAKITHNEKSLYSLPDDCPYKINDQRDTLIMVSSKIKEGPVRGYVIDTESRQIISKGFEHTTPFFCPMKLQTELKNASTCSYRIAKPYIEGAMVRIFKFKRKIYFSLGTSFEIKERKWCNSKKFHDIYKEDCLHCPFGFNLFNLKDETSSTTYIFFLCDKNLESVCENPEGLIFMCRLDLDTTFPKGIFNPNDENSKNLPWFETIPPIPGSKVNFDKFLKPEKTDIAKFKKGTPVVFYASTEEREFVKSFVFAPDNYDWRKTMVNGMKNIKEHLWILSRNMSPLVHFKEKKKFKFLSFDVKKFIGLTKEERNLFATGKGEKLLVLEKTPFSKLCFSSQIISILFSFYVACPTYTKTNLFPCIETFFEEHYWLAEKFIEDLYKQIQYEEKHPFTIINRRIVDKYYNLFTFLFNKKYSPVECLFYVFLIFDYKDKLYWLFCEYNKITPFQEKPHGSNKFDIISSERLHYLDIFQKISLSNQSSTQVNNFFKKSVPCDNFQTIELDPDEDEDEDEDEDNE